MVKHGDFYAAVLATLGTGTSVTIESKKARSHGTCTATFFKRHHPDVVLYWRSRNGVSYFWVEPRAEQCEPDVQPAPELVTV